MTLAELEQRLPPPGHVVTDRGWADVAREIGAEFGSDFRTVIERYGQGYFEQGLTLFDPRRWRYELEIVEVLEIMADPELRYPGKEHPHPPHPGAGTRLLPVGANGSGGYLMATLVDGAQDEDRYWLGDLDVDDFTAVPGPLSRVLLGLLTGDATRAWQISPPFHPV